MKEFDFTRILFLITSLAILIMGIFIPKSNLVASIIGALVIISLIVFDAKAPTIAKLSKENPKVKTMRFVNRLTICILTIGSLFAVLSPLESSFSNQTNELIIVGVASVIIMVLGNISPKIPFNRYMGLRLPWTIRDEDTWKISHKILGYLSFPIAIIMFVLSFFFDIEKVAVSCILIWIFIPSLYSLFFYYNKMKKIID